MYLFKKRYKRVLASWVDAVGSLFFEFPKVPPPVSIPRLLVIRIDHLGDVVFAEPSLRLIRQRFPKSHISFLTSPLGKASFQRLDSFDEIIEFQPNWFHPFPGFLKSFKDFFKLSDLVRSSRADVVVDLRGDFRHILACRLGLPRAWILSYGTTGGSFLLNSAPAYPWRVHAAEKNRMLLQGLGLSTSSQAIELDPGIASDGLSPWIKESLPPKEEKWIVLHPDAGTRSKEWPIRSWSYLVQKLLGYPFRFFWIGDEKAQRVVQSIKENLPRSAESRFINFCGRLPVSQLGTFLEQCDLLISADSGPVHVASAHGVKTLVLFSGTNELHEWKPLGENTEVLYHEVPCSPCHERICPLPRHVCMEDLDPERVMASALRLLEEVPKKAPVPSKPGFLAGEVPLRKKRPKTIVWDVRMISHPGIGRYIRSLLEALLDLDPPYEFILAGQKREILSLAETRKVAHRSCEVPIYSLAEQIHMPQVLRGGDLIHIPHFNIPYFVPGRFVVTLHDLIYFRFREYAPFLGSLSLLKVMYRRIAQKALRIITVSESTRRDFETLFGAGEKIRVIHEAAHRFFTDRRSSEAGSWNGVRKVRERFGLQHPYILAVGSLRAHKNILGLLSAFERLVRERGKDVDLVLTGRLDYRFERRTLFWKRIAELKRIRYLGQVDDTDLKELYENATCFVMPSFYEGFGLPVLEAMACGSPVISSNAASLPEVVGDAGLYFEPDHIDRLTELLYNVLSDNTLRQSLISKGLDRARRFSWSKAAEDTLKVYDEALS